MDDGALHIRWDVQGGAEGSGLVWDVQGFTGRWGALGCGGRTGLGSSGLGCAALDRGDWLRCSLPPAGLTVFHEGQWFFALNAAGKVSQHCFLILLGGGDDSWGFLASTTWVYRPDVSP
jgi:hypothetical protein